MKCPRNFGVFRIAFAYIGTVVGAGFASGQEILRFFSSYGIAGFWGIAISSALFFFFGYSALILGKKLKAGSHLKVVKFTNGRLFGTAVDFIITLFLFGGFAVMIAGAGAVLKEQFGVSILWGAIIMAFISLLTVFTGTEGVVNAISAIAPLLILSVVFIFVCNLINNPVSQGEIEASRNLSGATPNWLLSAFNYVSYNVVVAVAVLAPIGAEAKNERSILYGALFGSIGLGLCMAAINYCVITNVHNIAGLEVPMIYMASEISPVFRSIFAVILFGEIYSTAVGDLYGLTQRISLNLPQKLFIALATAGAFAASQLGFSNLVRILYPAVGYGALIFFIGTIHKWIVKPEYFHDLPGKIKQPRKETSGAAVKNSLSKGS